MRGIAILAALSLAGCTQILDLDDAVVVAPEQTVAVPPFDAVLVDGGVDAFVDSAQDVEPETPGDAAKED